MVAISILLGLIAAALTNAQTIETSSASSVAPSTTVSQAMPPIATQAFNPAPVNDSVRFNWCLAQQNNCPQICGGAASLNTCDEVALTYECVCQNGTVPDVTSFANTLPFFLCQETYIQCVGNNPDDAQAQSVCSENEQCGTRNATAEALAQTSAPADSSASSTGASESGAGGSATAAASSGAASETEADSAAVANVRQLSTGAFAALLLAACKLLL